MAGHTGDGRSEIVAYRPAPIQVSYLGYPGTTGSKVIDYIIADNIVAPLRTPAVLQRKNCSFA